jgi:hypothetical protein
MNRTLNSFAARIILTQFLLVCVLAGNGCQSSDKPGSASFASVTISGNTPGQIRDTAIEVFHDDGYKVARREPTRMVFEKEGTGMNNFAYGSWLGDTPVWVRVKASIEPAGEMTFRLQCTAYMVRDIGGSTEEEIKVSGLHRGAYQKLLDEVANRLTRK